MERKIIINGKTYIEAPLDRMEIMLIDDGVEIARTWGAAIMYYAGSMDDIKKWADIYEIGIIADGKTKEVLEIL